MALAIIECEEAGGPAARFRIDIGRNAYYSYAVGGMETTRQNGIEVLLDPVFTSPVLGPLAAAARGRAVLEVPAARFDAKHRRIQLASFRTRDRVGPALSDVVAVPVTTQGGADLPPPIWMPGDAGARAGRPPAGLAQAAGAIMMRTTALAGNVPYSYQRAETYSSAMFLQAITAILPQVLPALGSLFGAIAKAPAGGGDTARPASPLARLADPETAKLLTELLRQISGAKSLGRSLAYRNAESQRAAAHALSRYRHEFSEAKVAPALLAAIPALMPIIEKVLNPETMKAIMENVSPAKLVGTVTDAVGNFAKLGMEDTKQLQEHLERLNPGVRNPELYKLLEGLSTGEARAGSKLRYRRTDRVELSLTGTSPHTLYGRSRLAYRYGQDLSFPVDVRTPRPLRNATLEVCVKEAATLRIVYEKRHRVDEVADGPLEPVPSVPWNALSRLRAGDDYLLSLVLCWPGRKGAPKLGTALSQLITLVGDYAFDRVEDSAPDLVALDDADRDREFWHKVWDQTFADRGLTRVRMSCEYCYVLEGQRSGNARMQTKTRLQDDAASRRREGSLESGLILSADALNKLLPRVSSGADQPLADPQLDALRTPDFVDRFNQSAKTQVDFKGRRGESAALWVYPEMKLREVVLKKIGTVNEHGHVETFEEETVRFPMPAMVHFVGASSAS